MAGELDKKVFDTGEFNKIPDKNELLLYQLTPDNSKEIEASLDEAIRKQIDIAASNQAEPIKQLSSTIVSFAANADTTLYTVPNNKRCVLAYAIVVAGADAGASTTLAIGQDTAETDFVPANTLSNLDAQYDAVIIRPVPNTTPLKSKAYAGGTVIEAQVGSQSGGVGNTIYLFGLLY